MKKTMKVNRYGFSKMVVMRLFEETDASDARLKSLGFSYVGDHPQSGQAVWRRGPLEVFKHSNTDWTIRAGKPSKVI